MRVIAETSSEKHVTGRLIETSGADPSGEFTANPAKGLLAGAVGGLAGTVVMTLFQNAITRLSSPLTRTRGFERRERTQDDSDPATVQAADTVSRLVIGRTIQQEHRNLAGQAMHYGFGTSMGMLYGVTAEYAPVATVGSGSAFGTVLMVGADEVAVPLAGFSDSPTQTPASTHLYALAAHVVYGITCEQVRRRVRHSLD